MTALANFQILGIIFGFLVLKVSLSSNNSANTPFLSGLPEDNKRVQQLTPRVRPKGWGYSRSESWTSKHQGICLVVNQ